MILRNFEVKITSEMVRCLEGSKEATECGEMFDRRKKQKNPIKNCSKDGAKVQ